MVVSLSKVSPSKDSPSKDINKANSDSLQVESGDKAINLLTSDNVKDKVKLADMLLYLNG